MIWLTAVFSIIYLSPTASSSDLPGLEYLNTDIDPCEDFYEFTCGNFKHVNPRPPKEPIWDHFIILQRAVNNLAKEILSSTRTESEPQALQKAKAFYASCLDINYADQLGYPQLNVFDSFGKWPAISEDFDESESKLTWNQMAEISAQFGLQFLLNFHTVPALLNPKQNAIYIETDSVHIPEASGCRPVIEKQNPSDYLHFENTAGGNNAPLLKFLQRIAVKLRNLTSQHKPITLIQEELRETIKFMHKVAEKGIPPDPNVTLTFLLEAPVKTLQNWTTKYFGNDFLNWTLYFNTLLEHRGLKTSEKTIVIVQNYTKLYGILNLYKHATSRQLKNYVMTRLFTHMAPDGEDFMRGEWNQYAKETNMTVYTRPEYCLQKTIGTGGAIELSLAVTHEYQKYHFNVNKLEKAAAMVENLQKTFLDMLLHSQWMDKTSAAKARKKTLKMLTLLGFPSAADNPNELNQYYDGLRVCTWDHFGNSQRLRMFNMLDNLKDIAHPKLRTEWKSSPLEVNAYYHPANNRILFPVSMLNPIFFQGDYNVFDYARIGSIIGHEITHGFDAGGSAFNEDGVVGGLWTAETKSAFDKRKKCFQEQYSKYYIPEIDANVNGNTTINENLADNGGLRMAYQAFTRLMHPNDDKLLKDTGYTSDQLFFIGFGTMWCMQETPEYLKKLSTAGVYAPGRFRVAGAVSNMPEFAAAFQCPLGSNMNPKDKCVLW